MPALRLAGKPEKNPGPGWDYRKIRTEFVRERLRRTPWGRREYIHGLMSLERYVIEGYSGYCGSIGFNLIRQKYPAEYEAICKEVVDRRLASPRMVKQLADELRERPEREKAAKRAKLEEERARAAQLRQEKAKWLALGGRS